MARITDISDPAYDTPPEGFYGQPRRSPRNRTLLISAGVLLLVAAIASGVYYMLWQKKQTLDQTRLKAATDFEDAASRKMAPDQLPQDLELRQAVEMYNRGYLKPAQAAFQQIVESSKPAEVKSMALTYLGIMADDEGKFNLAADFFDRAIKFDERNFYAHYNMAIALRHKGMY